MVGCGWKRKATKGLVEGAEENTSMLLHGVYFCKENANHARYYWQLYFNNTKLSVMPVHVFTLLSSRYGKSDASLMSFCTDLFSSNLTICDVL